MGSKERKERMKMKRGKVDGRGKGRGWVRVGDGEG